jgi:hypothetical protein
MNKTGSPQRAQRKSGEKDKHKRRFTTEGTEITEEDSKYRD